MIRALFSAASGMTAQQMNVDNIANNLANAATNGYKARRVQFQDLLYQNLLQPGASASQQTVVPVGLQLGLGTRPSGNEIISTQGSFSETGNPLDVAIQGRGFFQGLQPNGQLASARDGEFQLDKNGNVVTASGNPLQPQITIPADAQSITIAGDGTVSYTQPNQTAAQVAGQIQLANFQNPAGLSTIGGNLYTPTEASGDATLGNPGGAEGLGALQQGYTEQSNVSVVQEMVNLIVSQRAYEANSKVVTAANQMYQQANGLVTQCACGCCSSRLPRWRQRAPNACRFRVSGSWRETWPGPCRSSRGWRRSWRWATHPPRVPAALTEPRNWRAWRGVMGSYWNPGQRPASRGPRRRSRARVSRPPSAPPCLRRASR